LLQTSMFAFASDMHDEGLGVFLDNVEHRGGVDGVSIAVAYHEARDVFPHNPVHKVRFLEGGALFFPPERSRWAEVRLQPPVSELARVRDPLGDLRAAADARGLAVHAWAVFLHNGALATAYPDCARENAYGDRYITDLCPAHPDVRKYVQVLIADIASRGVSSILAESLHYQPFEHGYAHERCFVALSPLSRYLLGLCFCAHCLRAAERRGVDGQPVRRIVRAELDRAFDAAVEDDAREPNRQELNELVDGEFGGYLAMREETVSSLVLEAAESAWQENETDLLFIDPSGALKGYTHGQPTGAPAASIAWTLGIDIAEVCRSCAGLEVLGYAADPERLRIDLNAYQTIASKAPRAVALRPMHPDCSSHENLRRKLDIGREFGVGRVDFYHYGFMPLAGLDCIRRALISDRV
jgi:hypothetical protein